MPVLIGELEKITGSPSSVTQVMVRAHTTRITGSALTTDELVPIPVDRQGRFEVPLRPGKAVLVLVHGGRVGEGERFPLLVEEGLGTITSAIKLASDRFNDYEINELEQAAADMLAHIDKSVVSARQAEVAKEGAEKERAAAETARTDAQAAAGTAATDAVQKADEKLSGYVTAASGAATSAGKDAGRAESARERTETIQRELPAKISEEVGTQLPSELGKHLPGELDERVPPLVASSIADDRTVADAAAAAVSDAAAGIDLVESSDPRVPTINESPRYAAIIGDGDHAALAVTTGGEVVLPRIDDSTQRMLLKRIGPADALSRGENESTDYYPWRITDRDRSSAPLAVRYDGAVDFRRLTPEAITYLSEVLSSGSADTAPQNMVWAVDERNGVLYTTHVPTGRRILLTDEAGSAAVNGAVITWTHGGELLWRNSPTEGPWKAANFDRFAIWGSSTAEEFGPAVNTAVVGLGATTVYEGGRGYDRAENILARMGAAPYTLSSAVTIPASGTTTVPIEGNPLAGAGVSIAGALGGVPGSLRLVRGARFEFTSAEGPTTIPAGAQFIPDAQEWRDAPALLQIGKNDLSANASANYVIDKTGEAYEWMRTLPQLTLIMGHHANHSWGASDPKVVEVEKTNAAYKRLFGARYVDLAGYITSPQVWEDTGLTPTAEDLHAQTDGLMPLSLSRDSGIHFSETANTAIADHLVKPHLQKIGWY